MIEEVNVDSNLTRPSIPVTPLPNGTPSFILGPKNKSYKHQFANIYFTRLHELRKFAEESAVQKWAELDAHPQLKTRVLDVEKGDLCYIVGTVYLDMPVKPNILEDIGRDQTMPAPPPPDKIYSTDDSVHLEDESGRIKLVGKPLESATLVTGVIIAVLGMENDNSEFEITDLSFCGMAPQMIEPSQADDMDVDEAVPKGEWVALISGLEVGSTDVDNMKHDIRIQLLVEYLASEVGSSMEQSESSRISRLIIAGNSFFPLDPIQDLENLNEPRMYKDRPRKLVTTASHPAEVFADYLLDITRSLPVHLMAGEHDPSSITLPQQPMPRAMFGDAKNYESFKCETNPTWMSFGGCSMLGTSGQPLNDMCKYLPDPLEPDEHFTGGPQTSLRLRLCETTLQCRHIAPTAPDTLHCFPYFGADPFILKHTPHIYFHGNQPLFETQLHLIGNLKCRVICIPKFVETGQIVLVNTRTLGVKLVDLDVAGMDKDDMPG